MRERPIGGLVEALTQLGAVVEATDGCPPVRISGTGLPGGVAHVSGDVSSQFVSAVLMVAPYARRQVALEIRTPLASRPYVDMTIAVMRAFGIEVRREAYRSFSVAPATYRSPAAYAIEPDASAASYFFAAPAICGGSVLVEGIPRDSLQGDVGFLGLLQAMGCEVAHTDEGVRVTGAATLRGIDADMCDIPDTAQTLAAVAPFAATPTRIRGIATARVKETDRIRATCTELRRLGVRVDEHEDGMTIHPCDRFVPATVRTYADHRMAMAFAIIGLRVSGVTIDDPSCVSKTFPGFFDVLHTLR
jgi:3-phosphoshikimate 1-carboxyvinyltransferase